MDKCRDPVSILKEELQNLENEVTRLDLENQCLRQDARINQYNAFKLQEIQRIASTATWELDQISNRLKYTDELLAMLKCTSQELSTWDGFLSFVHPEERAWVDSKLQDSIASKSAFEIEHRLQFSNHTIKYVKHFCKPFCLASGMVVSTVGLIQDITELKKIEQELTYLANFDALTGLPNRHLFQDRLLHAIEQADRYGNKIALLFLDLDNFKGINDALGHSIGDGLLVQVAERIKCNIREADTVARFGGDEFVIIIDQVSNMHQVCRVTEHLLMKLNDPYDVEGHNIFSSASIGVTCYPEDGKNINKLLKNADSAMFRAKEEGHSKYFFFTKTLNEEAKDRLRLESKLRVGLKENNFYLCYQPQLEIATGRVIGAEALLRCKMSSDQRPILPEHFIPILEETGLIIPIGEWVLEQACKTAKNWQQNGFENFRIAVNMTAKQFQRNDIVELIQTILLCNGLDSKDLEIELTESTLIDSSVTRQNLKSLENLGIRLAVDDFGTGYSSLSYLQKYAIDVLKIDRSFIENLGKNNADDSVVSAIIVLSHTLGMRVVAEGVETVIQLEHLSKLNCDYAQGFFIGQPMLEADFKEWLVSHGSFPTISCGSSHLS